MQTVEVYKGGTPLMSIDSTAGVVHSFTVPSNTLREIVSCEATLVTSARVGNRALSMWMTDGADRVLTTPALTVAASQEGTFVWIPGGDYNTAVPRRLTDGAASDVGMMYPMPPIVLHAGCKVVVMEQNIIDAANDKLTAALCYRDYYVP